MALQIVYQTQYGVTASQAYAKIEGYGVRSESVSVSVAIYYDQDARSTNLQPVSYLNVSVAMDHGGNYEAVYDALKTLPEFANATDV